MPEDTPDQGPRPADPRARDWKSLHLWQIQGVRDILLVLGILGLLWLGQKISVVTVPLLLAILFAYLFEPVIRWLIARTSLHRRGAVTLVLVATILVVVVPSAIGLTFGVAQTAALVQQKATETTLLVETVRKGVALRRVESSLNTALKVQQADAALEPETGDTSETPEGEEGAEPVPPDLQPIDDADLRPLDADTLDQPLETDADPGDAEPLQDPGVLPGPPLPAPAGDGLISESELDKLKERFALREIEYQDSLESLRRANENFADVAEYIYNADEGEAYTTILTTVQGWLTANAQGIANAGADAVRSTLVFLGGIFGLLFMGFITAFFFYFFATGWVQVQAFSHKLIPEKHSDVTLDLLRKFDAVISAFIRGRLTIAFIQAVVFTVGYLVIGVPAAFILGPILAVLSIVPYLALVGLPVSVLLLAIEDHTGFRGEWWWVVGAPVAFYFLAQALDDYVWTPMIQGKGTDMSTPMILFASLAGGALFGVFGLLIAIPIAACIKILVQEIFWPRFKAWADGEEADFLPIARR